MEKQFFGARANLAKCLLYAVNGGRDEKTGEQVGPEYTPVNGDFLDNLASHARDFSHE